MLVVQRWILARLRNRQFFSLRELNARDRRAADGLNDRPFKKLPGLPPQAFESIDRPAMKPLPPPATSTPSGSRRRSTSTITSRPSGITTACRTRWLAST